MMSRIRKCAAICVVTTLMALTLSGCVTSNVTREVPVDFIPWEDGQQITYSSADGQAYKTFSFTLDAQNQLWIIDSVLTADKDTLTAHTQLREVDLMAVRSSLTMTSAQPDANWTISGEYLTDGEPWLSVTTPEGTQTEQFDSVPAHLYEFETFCMTMRTFPLTADFEAPVNLVFLSQSGLGGAYINGNGIVAIDGEPCYHLYLSTDRNVAIDHQSVFAQVWISTGQNRTVVQFTAGQALFTLNTPQP